VAGVASAQQLVCIDLDDGNADTPPLLYRLTLTFPGNNTASIVGTAIQGGDQRVVTGGGALIGGQAELSLQATDIATIPLTGVQTLVGTSAHVILNGPSFTSGIFKAAQVRALLPLGQTVTLSEGTATVVGCP
jgi:hypothetical protein